MTRVSAAFVLASACALAVDVDLAGAQNAAPLRLTVAEAIARGFEASHRLAEIKAREQGALAAVQGAHLADRPIASASAGYSRTNHVPEFGFVQNGVLRVLYPDIPDNVITRVQFQWPIYTSGRVDAMERAAVAESQAVAADIETARADLRFEIVRAYWATATAGEAVHVLEDSMSRADAQLRDARQRFSVGLIPPNEVSSLEAQRSREEAQLIEARNMQESTLVDLRRLVGADPGALIELADSLMTAMAATSGSTTTDTINEALAHRTERKALTLRIGGAEARRQMAATGNKPSIGIGGGFDYANPNPRIFPREGAWQDSWDVSVNVNWPFFDSGRTRAQMSEAAAAVTATKERLAEFDTVVAADVRQRLLDLDSSQAMVRAASAAVTSAAEARRVVGDRYAAGVATSTDVLVSQTALLEAGLARTRAMAGVKLAEARLHRSLGRP